MSNKYWNKPAERHPGRAIEQDYVTRRFLTKRQYLRDLELMGRINKVTTRRIPHTNPRRRQQITLSPVVERLDTYSRYLVAVRITNIHNAKLKPANDNMPYVHDEEVDAHDPTPTTNPNCEPHSSRESPDDCLPGHPGRTTAGSA